MYRRLARQVHPDSLGDDGSAFLYLQERFERFILEWTERRRERDISRGIDPYRVIRDLGIETDGSDRCAFWITLY